MTNGSLTISCLTPFLDANSCPLLQRSLTDRTSNATLKPQNLQVEGSPNFLAFPRTGLGHHDKSVSFGCILSNFENESASQATVSAVRLILGLIYY